MRAISIEETTAISAIFLDDFLRGGGPHRDRLLFNDLRRYLSIRAGRLHCLWIHKLGDCIWLEILRDALRDQEERSH